MVELKAELQKSYLLLQSTEEHGRRKTNFLGDLGWKGRHGRLSNSLMGFFS